MPDTPDPGTAEAVELGCECPIAANNFGTRPPLGGWKIAADCPIHDNPRSAA